MASSSGSDDVPAARAAVAVNDLIQARDGAARLRAFLLQLDDPRAARALLEIDGVLAKLSSAMSALDAIVSDAAAAVGRNAAAGAGSDGARPQPQQSCGNKRKQSSSSSSRSTSQRPSDRKITATLEDGHVWRKYGQKEIQDSAYPRSYYRCTHKSDQGCNAKRQVQLCETDTSKYVVTYYGEHTCRDLSTTIPLIIDQAAARAVEHDDDDHANNLISFEFGPSSTNNAASSNGGASSSQYLAMMGGSGAAADQQLSTSWCTSDDVFSSSAGSFMQVDELIGAVVGSAGVVTTSAAAPDRGGVLGGGMAASGGGRGTASFPPSPNSLGFVMGSLGSIGGGEDDDDMFRLDP